MLEMDAPDSNGNLGGGREIPRIIGDERRRENPLAGVRRWWLLDGWMPSSKVDTYRQGRGDSSSRLTNQMLAHSHTGSRDPSIPRADASHPSPASFQSKP